MLGDDDKVKQIPVRFKNPLPEDRTLVSLTERNMLQMSQVLGRDRKPSRPQARDIAEAVAHQTLQAGHAILLRRRVRR